MRANTNISLKKRNTITFENFRGVDYSSSPLRVSTNRASKMRNLINEYGVNHKRPGWNELFKIVVDGKEQRINGIFQYKTKEHEVLLVHAGAGIYTIKDGAIVCISRGKPFSNNLIDQRSQCFIQKQRAYLIGCGDFLVYGTWDGETYELRRVADDADTYIPTTTISIDNDSVTDDTARASLDDTNMLCSLRKNKLLGTNKTPATWTVDSKKIKAGTEVRVSIELEDTMKDVVSSGDKLLCDEQEVGSIDREKGKITLTIDTTPPIENRDNITVTFNPNEESLSDRITKCSFGILFGVGGNTNRLFLSGNEDYPNVDFHSEANDYTYFSPLNTGAMGSDSTAIKGYARLSDSTLVAYKEESDIEASIYYRSGAYRETYDENGNLDEQRAVFSITAGAIGEGVVSRYACANLAGDNLILSNNGVFGIVLANNVATNERYVRERSHLINEKLKEYDLSEAVGCVFNGRYYLAVADNCFVADARFKYSGENDIDGSYNYEWWHWDNIPARVWAKIGEELYFGTAKGQICKFDNLEHTDRTYENTEVGDIAIDISENHFTYGKYALEEEVEENDIITFITNESLKPIYALFFEVNAVQDNAIVTDEDGIDPIYEEIEVYADNVGLSGLEVGKKYFTAEVDKAFYTFKLKDEEGNIVEINDGGFRLHRRVSDTELYVTNAIFNNRTFQVKRNQDSAPLTLTNYNEDIPTAVIAKITHRNNVVAEWYSPVLDLGSNECAKTLFKITVATEPEVNGHITFGYETREVSRLFAAKGVHVFSFDSIDFENFTFDTGFATSYSKLFKERNFNYILFRFLSDNQYDAAVNSVTAVYNIHKHNKGVQ
ncbi:MAG: hypothetical protein IJ033_03850 [Clostridia bacterium]|nr:hypothetical protein [Clostridia bacterium]